MKSTLNIHWKDWCWTEPPILWPSDVKSWLIGKNSDAGKDWRQEEWTIEDEMVGWHPLTPWTWVWASSRCCDGQGNLEYCSPWGHKESDTTFQLSINNSNSKSCKWTIRSAVSKLWAWRYLMAVQELGNADSEVMLWWAANRSFGINIFLTWG